MQAQRIKIFGERNTGTNALGLLIRENIGDILCPSVVTEVVSDWPAREAALAELAEPYRWFMRHALIDDIFAGAPAECQYKHTCPQYSARFAEQQVGIIFLVKNPYSWLASLYRRPHAMLLPSPPDFASFLRRPWLTLRRENLPSVLASPVELWNRKVAAYRRFAKLAEGDALPCLFVQFEDFVADQLQTLRRIREIFEFPGGRAAPITASTKVPDLDLAYYEQYYRNEVWRSRFTPEDFAFCAATIDWSTAARFGYQRLSGLEL